MTSPEAAAIAEGRTALGIELGSTRIKAVLIGPDHQPIAAGAHEWESELVEGNWTYSTVDVWSGLRSCYAALAEDVRARHGVRLRRLSGLGVSAMMHGYLALDREGQLLTPFRTWRNTNTTEAAHRLSAELGCNIPLRWSVAHLYQAMLDAETHVGDIATLTTLAGYVHQSLTGARVLGIGDASGMFPIDTHSGTYDPSLLAAFDRLAREAGSTLALADCLPEIRAAGANGGTLTPAGAFLLDPTGGLQPGARLCPPEGDAGTGMVATNTVSPRTANVSAGTSVFAMVVLEDGLRDTHREGDLVTTPSGRPVAMVHCNNGASELNTWVNLFAEVAARIGSPLDRDGLFATLLRAAVVGAADCGGLMSYNCLSGEPILALERGRPLFFRDPESRLDLATFMRTQVFAAFAALRVGMNILMDREGVRLDRVVAHGGLFKTPGVADRLLAAALDTPVAVEPSAGEGGAWGIALLAAFSAAEDLSPGQELAEFLSSQVFNASGVGPCGAVTPDPADVEGFNRFLTRFRDGLEIERLAGSQRDSAGTA